MTFQVRTETRPASDGRDGTVHILEEAGGRARAEVWPANGFNCFRWAVKHGGAAGEMLYADPQFFQGGKPTRTGIPVLFPFPNRIRAGRFTWAGKEYQLPLDDPAGKNAIHGFACRNPWRVIAQGADSASAWVTGEFRGSLDDPASLALWPADYQIRLTLRLTPAALRLEALVENPDRVPLPFGLGYHPYFHVPALASDSPEDYAAQADPGQFWELEESLPTGKILPVDAAHDLRAPRDFARLTFDDVWHAGRSLAGTAGVRPLVHRASLLRRGVELVRLETSPAFRELVVFTPPHRHAVCFEPYTCMTDAINLQARGIDGGWLVLEPGERWQGEVVLALAGGPG